MTIALSSIRLKLTLATLVPLIAAIGLCWVIGASIITTRIASQAQQKVASDLNSAHEMMLGEQARLTDNIRLTGLSAEMIDALDSSSGNATAWTPLHVILKSDRLDFLTVTDRFGIVRYRTANPARNGDSLRREKLIGDALNGATSSGLKIFSTNDAALENPQLPEQIAIAIKSTPHARAYTRRIVDQGLFMVAASPVKDREGRVMGVVYGGMLLNNDNGIVDRITGVLFRKDESTTTVNGSATMFLDDIRIATTVRDEQGLRAIGSLMSDEVYASVSRGKKWIGRAFVLNGWSFSAYEPVRDYLGNIIGALYVGMPERSFLDIRFQINLIFTAVLVFVTLIGTAISAWLGTAMARPVKQLEEAVRRIGTGENLPDIVVGGKDEIARLAREFNKMKQRLEARKQEILTLNRTLEDKVVERTAQLEESSRLLLITQKELAQSEKLASIGLLASGVAHEINNPLAIIRGNAELLEMLTTVDSPPPDEVRTIIRQAERIERIVGNLLAFSRSGIKRLSSFSLQELLDEILDQIGHQIKMDCYTVERSYRGAARLMIEGDRNQLRQVVTNLVLNGLQAMASGGTLTVDAVVEPVGGRCRISVADNGPGVAPELMEKLFTPFFTTRDDGTGLGLAISYGIVKEHGGEIGVENRTGGGAVFTVMLPMGQTSGA